MRERDERERGRGSDRSLRVEPRTVRSTSRSSYLTLLTVSHLRGKLRMVEETFLSANKLSVTSDCSLFHVPLLFHVVKNNFS